MAKAKSTDLNDIMSMTFDDVPTDFDLPNAVYDFEVVRAKVSATEEDEPRTFVEVTLKAREVLSDDAPVTNEALNNAYPVREKLWLHTEGAKKFSKGVFDKIIGDDVKELDLRTILEGMLGQHVKGLTEQSAPNKDGRVYVSLARWMKADEATA